MLFPLRTCCSTPALIKAQVDAASGNVSHVGDFLVLSKTLGSGAFSRVHLAFSTKVHSRASPMGYLPAEETHDEHLPYSRSRNMPARRCCAGRLLVISFRSSSGRSKCSSQPRMYGLPP
jgi:hypothetical protein